MTAERDALAELVRCSDAERQKWGSVPAVQWDDAWAAARAVLAAQPAEPLAPDRHLTRDEQAMLGNALRKSARQVSPATDEYDLSMPVAGRIVPSITTDGTQLSTDGNGVFGSLPGHTEGHKMPGPSTLPAAAPAQGELQTEYQAGWDNCYAMAEPAISALRDERDDWKRKYGDANEWGLKNTAAWKLSAEKAEAECERLRADKDAYHYERAFVAWTSLTNERAERAEAERDALRECVRAADAMRDRLYKPRGDIASIEAYDAARAKVRP